MIGMIKRITVTFLEDEIFEGSIPQACYDTARIEYFECDDIDDALRFFETERLTFAATGTDWAADPDGSFISDYAIGERKEVTAHFEGFSDEDVATIIEKVG